MFDSFRHRVRGSLTVAWVAVAAMAAAIAPADAHRSIAGSTAGLPIPSLVHGQMAVIADNRAEILALADREPIQDETFQRLRNFINRQYFRCLWGLMPGSIDDEASPFNECSHAYLSATRALLLHMEGMPGDRARVRALIAKIDRQMIANSTGLMLCRYSDEPFNTADIVAPHWSDIPGHAPTLLALVGAGVLPLSVGGLALRRGRRRRDAASLGEGEGPGPLHRPGGQDGVA